MINLKYTIKDDLGIHARPAGVLAKAASKFASSVQLDANGKSCDMKRLFAIMSMGIKCGDSVTVTIEGTDEADALDEIKAVFEEYL